MNIPPYTLSTTQELLTSRAGLVTIAKVMQGLHLTEQINHAFPTPQSNRGFDPSVFVNSLVLMLNEGGTHPDDLRHIRDYTSGSPSVLLQTLYQRSSGLNIQSSSNSEVTFVLPVIQVIEKSGIQFALQECKHESDTVVCKLLLTSLKKDRDIDLGIKDDQLKTNLLDQSGDSHLSNHLCFDNNCGNSYFVRQSVFADIPVSVVYQIPVPSSTKKIVFFSIVFRSDKKVYKIAFPNISLTE